MASDSPAALSAQQVSSLVSVRNLYVGLPDNSVIVEAASLELHPGRVVALLGPSGSGKTTLLRAILAPAELRRAGYTVKADASEIAGIPAFVPQRGALLDHLDVADNISLAQAGSGVVGRPETWLRAVDLDEGFAAPGRAVSALSGGQAQRVAVARVLAAGRRIIVMDEPSVGLDPIGVRMLGRLLVTQARQHQAAIIVVTHDLALAGGAADEILFLDPTRRALATVAWDRPAELDEPATRQQRLADLEAAVEDLLLQDSPPRGAAATRTPIHFDLLAPFRVAGNALTRFLQPYLLRESTIVFRRTVRESFVRPALFYATVGALLGFTVPYIIANISKDLRPAAVFELIKGTYVLALSPPLSAILFAATSGSAVNAWLGGLQLHGQVTALEGVGVPPARYLWSPAWTALAVCYFGTFVIFTVAMILGGWFLYDINGVPNAASLLTADFLAPPPSRYPYLVRASWSVLAYMFAVASVVVAKGAEPKAKSEDVTAGMTSSVMRVTLFVVVMELLTVLAVRTWGPSGG